jgi:hypothetical protein
MARVNFPRFDSVIETRMQHFFQTLSEKDQRRYAAVEAERLGHGGIEYISEVLGCSTKTISRGIKELDELPNDPAAGRVRREGAGRKKKITPDSEIEHNLNSLMQTRTAGDPDDETIVFTDLTPRKLEQELDRLGTPASDDVIRQWMEDQDLRLRKIRKTIAGGKSPDRDAQFRNITRWIEEYLSAGNPYFSVDSKAKEFQGQLFREGRVRSTKAFEAFDHDFPSWAEGVIIPHGIYDLVRNRGHINIGLSRDTTQFACDSLKWYWNRIGQQCYPNADSILLLMDGGGSNSASKYIFKHDLQEVVNSIGIPIRVAHYPSYCSKYNPIERRFFPHVTRACTGMLFDTLGTAVNLMRKAATSTGLKTTVHVMNRLYETGRNATQAMKDVIRSTISFDKLLPKWNYTLTPQTGH